MMWTPPRALHAYKTYGIRQPLSTHFRKATCEEIDCAAFLCGWTLDIAGLPEELYYLATHSGRHFIVKDNRLVFSAGQPCFKASQHVVPLERNPEFLVGRGHYSVRRKSDVRRHDSADNWMDDLQTHMERLRRADNG